MHLRHEVRSCHRREQVFILRKLSLAKRYVPAGSEAKVKISNLSCACVTGIELFHGFPKL